MVDDDDVTVTFLDVKRCPKFDTAYQSPLGLRAAGSDVRTGCMVVAEHPAVCR